MKITEKRNNRDFISKKNRDFLIKLMKISEISRLFSKFENNREITENNREITEKQNNRDFLPKNNRFLG